MIGLQDAPDCERCRILYDKRRERGIKPDTPPCHKCRPHLMQGNEDAAAVYQLVQRQILTAGMGEVVDLNHLAVWRLIDELGVENRLETFLKVVGTFQEVLQEQKRANVK